MAWSTFHCHISKLTPRHFVILLASQLLVVPSTSIKTTIYTLGKKFPFLWQCTYGIQWDTNLVYMLSSKIENAHWTQKTTATHCCVWETETTRNFVLWLFLNNRNAFWHVKICHEAKVVSWLLKEMTTSSDFTKIPQGAVNWKRTIAPLLGKW